MGCIAGGQAKISIHQFCDLNACIPPLAVVADCGDLEVYEFQHELTVSFCIFPTLNRPGFNLLWIQILDHILQSISGVLQNCEPHPSVFHVQIVHQAKSIEHRKAFESKTSTI